MLSTGASAAQTLDHPACLTLHDDTRHCAGSGPGDFAEAYGCGLNVVVILDDLYSIIFCRIQRAAAERFQVCVTTISNCEPVVVILFTKASYKLFLVLHPDLFCGPSRFVMGI